MRVLLLLFSSLLGSTAFAAPAATPVPYADVNDNGTYEAGVDIDISADLAAIVRNYQSYYNGEAVYESAHSLVFPKGMRPLGWRNRAMILVSPKDISVFTTLEPRQMDLNEITIRAGGKVTVGLGGFLRASLMQINTEGGFEMNSGSSLNAFELSVIAGGKNLYAPLAAKDLLIEKASITACSLELYAGRDLTIDRLNARFCGGRGGGLLWKVVAMANNKASVRNSSIALGAKPVWEGTHQRIFVEGFGATSEFTGNRVSGLSRLFVVAPSRGATAIASGNSFASSQCYTSNCSLVSLTGDKLLTDNNPEAKVLTYSEVKSLFSDPVSQFLFH